MASEHTCAWRIDPDGNSSIRIAFGDVIDRAVNDRVHRYCSALAHARVRGVVEWVPAYASVAVYYDPSVIKMDAAVAELGRIDLDHPQDSTASVVEIPVLYDGEYGPDIDRIAQLHGLEAAEVARRHAAVEYRCYMVGFLPGFPYLGEVPAELRAPRLATPRVRVPAGSVAIAEGQTGIYPAESPGGWNIIGRTPVPLFDATADPPCAILPGDRVRFVAIDEPRFIEIAELVERGGYSVSRSEL